jgi:hypothetical protein
MIDTVFVCFEGQGLPKLEGFKRLHSKETATTKQIASTHSAALLSFIALSVVFNSGKLDVIVH